MPWSVTVQLDPDKADVGRATATYTWPAGPYEGQTFTHSARSNVSAAAAVAFMDTAVAAKVSHEALLIANALRSGQLAALFPEDT